MKEIYRASEKALLAVPERLRDWATVKIATYWLDFGLGHRVKTGRARFWGHEMLMRWYRGEPTPLSEYAPRLLDGCSLSIQGMESLAYGGQIVVINQPNEGPLRGNWFKFLLNYAIAQSRKRQGDFESRWVQRADSSNPVIKKTPLSIQKRRLSQMVAQSCNTILIDPTIAFRRENIRAVGEMRRYLYKGGVLVICPEGGDHKVLGRGREEVGELLVFLIEKTRVPVRPAAAWNVGADLNLRFGEEIDTNNFDHGNGQRVADLVMTEIARILPKGKRGVYQRLAEEQVTD